MALHIAAWIVLLLVSVNTLVLEYSGLSSLRLLAFGRYRLQRQRSAVPAPGNDTAATMGAIAAEAAAVAAGYRAKRGIASGLDSIDDIAALAPSISWYYNWGTLPVQPPQLLLSCALHIIYLRAGRHVSPCRLACPTDILLSQDNVTGEVAMAAGMEFVPMQWGRWGIQNLDRQLGLMSPRPAALLGFNEPTHIGQVEARLPPLRRWSQNHLEACNRLLHIQPCEGRLSAADWYVSVAVPQANMMPQLAAAMWPTLEAAAAKYSLRLGSPSAAGCGAWWVQQL